MNANMEKHVQCIRKKGQTTRIKATTIIRVMPVIRTMPCIKEMAHRTTPAITEITASM